MYDANQNHSIYFGSGNTASAALDDAAAKARQVERNEDRCVLYGFLNLDSDGSYVVTLLVDDAL